MRVGELMVSGGERAVSEGRKTKVIASRASFVESWVPGERHAGLRRTSYGNSVFPFEQLEIEINPTMIRGCSPFKDMPGGKKEDWEAVS